MDKKQAVKISQRYLSTLSRKYDIAQTYLYGSYAKGTNHAGSDIDLAIVIASSVRDMIDVQIDLMQMRSKENLLIEPHPFRITDFNKDNPVVAEILSHGIEINI